MRKQFIANLPSQHSSWWSWCSRPPLLPASQYDLRIWAVNEWSSPFPELNSRFDETIITADLISKALTSKDLIWPRHTVAPALPSPALWQHKIWMAASCNCYSCSEPYVTSLFSDHSTMPQLVALQQSRQSCQWDTNNAIYELCCFLLCRVGSHINPLCSSLQWNGICKRHSAIHKSLELGAPWEEPSSRDRTREARRIVTFEIRKPEKLSMNSGETRSKDLKWTSYDKLWRGPKNDKSNTASLSVCVSQCQHLTKYSSYGLAILIFLLLCLLFCLWARWCIGCTQNLAIHDRRGNQGAVSDQFAGRKKHYCPRQLRQLQDCRAQTARFSTHPSFKYEKVWIQEIIDSKPSTYTVQHVDLSS